VTTDTLAQFCDAATDSHLTKNLLQLMYEEEEVVGQTYGNLKEQDMVLLLELVKIKFPNTAQLDSEWVNGKLRKRRSVSRKSASASENTDSDNQPEQRQQ
jgi:hypothetical protein